MLICIITELKITLEGRCGETGVMINNGKASHSIQWNIDDYATGMHSCFKRHQGLGGLIENPSKLGFKHQ